MQRKTKVKMNALWNTVVRMSFDVVDLDLSAHYLSHFLNTFTLRYAKAHLRLASVSSRMSSLAKLV